MSRCLAIGLGWAALVAAMTVSATAEAVDAVTVNRTPFDDFQSLCVTVGGHAADSLKAADQVGWLPMAAADLPKFPVNVVSGDARRQPPDHGAGLLVAGRGRYLFDGVEILFDLCGLAAEGHDLTSGAATWVGVEPADTYPDGSRVYLFFQDGDHHRPAGGIDTDEALSKASRAGQVWILVIGHARNGGFVAYGPIDRPPATPAPTRVAAHRRP